MQNINYIQYNQIWMGGIMEYKCKQRWKYSKTFKKEFAIYKIINKEHIKGPSPSMVIYHGVNIITIS